MIIGESLARVRSELRRGGWDWIFIAEYAIKSRFFALFSFCIHTKTRHSSLWGTKNSYPLGFFLTEYVVVALLLCVKTDRI